MLLSNKSQLTCTFDQSFGSAHDDLTFFFIDISFIGPTNNYVGEGDICLASSRNAFPFGRWPFDLTESTFRRINLLSSWLVRMTMDQSFTARDNIVPSLKSACPTTRWKISRHRTAWRLCVSGSSNALTCAKISRMSVLQTSEISARNFGSQPYNVSFDSTWSTWYGRYSCAIDDRPTSILVKTRALLSPCVSQGYSWIVLSNPRVR